MIPMTKKKTGRKVKLSRKARRTQKNKRMVGG